MEKLWMCRICLVEDVKMYSLISANLQEMYERLTDMPFVTKDKKPVQVCYLCRARLQNCQHLQATCLKSEELLKKVMSNDELKQMESQDLNTLKTVHPLIRISCVPSTGKDADDDNNDVKFDPSEITPDAQVKDELCEDDSFINEAVDIKLEVTVKDEDIGSEDGDMSDNSHTTQDTQLQHDIEVKPVEIVLERIDLKQFEIGTFAAKNPKIEPLHGNTESTISIDTPESEMTIIQNKNNEKIQTTRRAVIVENKNIVKQMSFTDKCKKKKIMDTCRISGGHSENNLTHKRNLISHTQHMVKKVYKCEVCDKSFTVKGRLVNHVRIHTGERPFKCITCNHSFTQKSHLIRHTRIHTGERPYNCITCSRSFSEKSSLVKHTRIHQRSYICNICGESFTQKGNLVTHKQIHTSEKSYRCNVCQKSFSRQLSLIRHLRIHIGDKTYKCIICDQIFSRKYYLVKHTRAHTERPYSCTTCNRRFSEKSSLVKHTRIHTSLRSYTCEICGKSFTQKNILGVHVQIHTGEKYVCNVCGKSFTRKGNLLSHIQIHTGEKPYKCIICKQSFSQKSYLVKHIRIHSGERLYICNTCGRRYTQKCNLVSHIKTHNG